MPVAGKHSESSPCCEFNLKFKLLSREIVVQQPEDHDHWHLHAEGQCLPVLQPGPGVPLAVLERTAKCLFNGPPPKTLAIRPPGKSTGDAQQSKQPRFGFFGVITGSDVAVLLPVYHRDRASGSGIVRVIDLAWRSATLFPHQSSGVGFACFATHASVPSGLPP